MKRMLSNLRKNKFWFLRALETYALGIYFIYRHSANVFTYPPILDALDDPPVIFWIACVGTVALIYALWDIKHYCYKPITTALLTGVWLVMFLSFTIHDFSTNTYLSLPGIYSFFVLVDIVSEIYNRG